MLISLVFGTNSIIFGGTKTSYMSAKFIKAKANFKNSGANVREPKEVIISFSQITALIPEGGTIYEIKVTKDFEISMGEFYKDATYKTPIPKELFTTLVV